uniref:Glycosyltransferase n=1 Tax=viral metagenome TaxID=1070528 RepID=A0A6C0D4V2_9ZZZZ
MNFTFGINTDGNNDDFIKQIIESIEKNNIPNFEVIIVGNSKLPNTDNVTIIEFDDLEVPLWITRKKNIIIENAKYENICFLHDYVVLNHGWYEGFLKFGNDWDWCVTKIIDVHGDRFRDFTLFPYKVDYLNLHYSPGEDIHPYFENHCLLPYDFVNNIKLNKYMYISGTYFIMKRDIARVHKLDERLIHGRGEDVELSKRLHANNIIIKCNSFSSVSFLKDKYRTPFENEMSADAVQFLVHWSNV